jgi:hypothetical protein
MKLLKPVRNPGRNAFDLSHRHLMTANFGELLPITCIETVPGDFIQLRVSDLLRACPMVTSPFMRVKQHIDVWWTPYDYMWHNFEQFITMKEDSVSSAMKGYDYVPHATVDMLHEAYNLTDPDLYTDVVGRQFTQGAKKILDYLGYGNLLHTNESSAQTTSYSVNLWRLAQYNKIWYDEYRQKYYDDGKRMLSNIPGYSYNAAALFNFDDLACTSVATARPIDLRLRAMCQMRYRLWKKDLFTGILPATQFGALSTVPITGNVTIAGSFDVTGTTGTDFSRHSFVAGDQSPLTPTFDSNERYFYGPYGQNDTSDTSNFLYSQTQDDDVDLGYYAKPASLVTVGGNGVRDVHNHSFEGAASMSTSASVIGAQYDILALRKAQAVQIWRENALRAGNRISDNMKAHYGADAEYDDHRSTFLGSVDAPLNIGDIDSHAQIGTGGNQQLADVAGKGLSSLDKSVVKFKAKKFGCIMVMFSLIPEAEYESQGIDMMNTLLEREDYFQSEFQNTGLSAVSDKNFYFAPVANNALGFAPAYIGYKQKLDKCYEQFWTGSPFAPWASPKSDVTYEVSSGTHIVGHSLATLYINPALFDRNFGVAVSGEIGAEATSEQVICDFYFDVNAVRPMSVVGLPQNI